MQVKVNINNEIHFLNEEMKFVTEPVTLQFIPKTPDDSNRINPNVFSLNPPNKPIMIYKTNDKEEKQQEGEKKESSVSEGKEEVLKTVDVAKNGNTSGSEKPEVEETINGEGNKSGVSQQWTITPSSSGPNLARINVGTDCLKVDPEAKVMIRGECPKVESLNNFDFYFEVLLNEVTNLSTLPRLKSENKDSSKDTGEEEKHVKRKRTRESEETRGLHRRKKTKTNYKSQDTESEKDSNIEDGSSLTDDEGYESIEENTESTEVSPEDMDVDQLISHDQPLFIHVKRKDSGPQEIPIKFEKVKNDVGDSVMSPVVVEKGLKKTLSKRSRPSANKHPMRHRSGFPKKMNTLRHKKMLHEPKKIRLSGTNKDGKTLELFVPEDSIKLDRRPLNTPSKIQSSSDSSKRKSSNAIADFPNKIKKGERNVPLDESLSNPQKNTEVLREIKKLTEKLRKGVEAGSTTDRPQESITSDLLSNQLKKNDISASKGNIKDASSHKSLKKDSVALLSSLNESVSALINEIS